MPVQSSNPTDDIDYIAVIRALQSMGPHQRKLTGRILEFMTDKRRNQIVFIASGLAFIVAMSVAAAQGVPFATAAAIALSSALLSAFVVLVILRLM